MVVLFSVCVHPSLVLEGATIWDYLMSRVLVWCEQSSAKHEHREFGGVSHVEVVLPFFSCTPVDYFVFFAESVIQLLRAAGEGSLRIAQEIAVLSSHHSCKCQIRLCFIPN